MPRRNRIMGRLGRYILFTAAVAFLAVVSTLTVMVWLTQALRRIDLLASQGQTLVMFASIVGLTLPTFLMVTAPFALFLAVLYTLNRFNGDSELIVMSSAGVSPWQVFRPLLVLALAVAMAVGSIAVYFAPLSMRTLRDRLAKVNADIVTNVAQPGRFTSIERGLVFHIRDRTSGGTLYGIFIHDAREKVVQTFIAERGRIIDAPSGLFLVLENGSLIRSGGETNTAAENSVVDLPHYAFDLSQFRQEIVETIYRPNERSLDDLLWPAANDALASLEPGRLRVELHQRMSAPLYPLAAFLIAFAFLGAPRTSRQSRWAALAGASLAVASLQLAQFACIGLVSRSAYAAPLPYLFPISAVALSLASIGGRFEARMPAIAQRIADALVRRVERLETA
jgi:lipopolysaccharide export system permease protein